MNRLVLGGTIQVLGLLLFLCGTVLPVDAAQMALVWSISKQYPLPVGFVIYYGLESRYQQDGSLKRHFQYDNAMSLSSADLEPVGEDAESVSYQVSFDNVTYGSRYFVSITAVDANGFESSYSAERDARKDVPDDTIDDTFFDLSFYLNRNRDVVSAMGFNYPALLEHWQMSGKYEGRSCSPLFDPNYYLEANPDLRAVYGDDFPATLDHWQYFGIDEGRAASPVFDVKYYLAVNPDLQAAFGRDYPAAIGHWLQYGVHEGRIASPHFNARAYLQNNRDLFDFFANDFRAATWHYLIHGIREGR